MDTHEFPDIFKVQRFCLAFIGETRLWYEFPRPIAMDWNCSQTQFRQEYSTIGNAVEQPYHGWMKFHSDENSEIIDSYVT